MLNGKDPLRTVKPAFCVRLSPRSIIFLGLAVAIVVHIATNTAYFPPKPHVVNVAAKGEDVPDGSDGERNPEPVAAAEAGNEDTEEMKNDEDCIAHETIKEERKNDEDAIADEAVK